MEEEILEAKEKRIEELEKEVKRLHLFSSYVSKLLRERRFSRMTHVDYK